MALPRIPQAYLVIFLVFIFFTVCLNLYYITNVQSLSPELEEQRSFAMSIIEGKISDLERKWESTNENIHQINDILGSTVEKKQEIAHHLPLIDNDSKKEQIPEKVIPPPKTSSRDVPNQAIAAQQVKTPSNNDEDQEFCALIPTSEVDIDMQEIYVNEEFANPKLGLAWVQGFPITANPAKKLTVHIMPHSHNDPGWIKTLEQYYETQTRSILTTVVDGLTGHPNRKFIWAEISYFSRWWKDQGESMREKARRLIQNKQLELVTSGWVMPDEANTHFYSLIDQLNLGHSWVNNVLGDNLSGKSSWQCDPFGHSSAYAWILGQTGLDHILIQRTHYVVKRHLAKEQWSG